MKKQQKETSGWNRTLATLKNLISSNVANSMTLVNERSPLFEQIAEADDATLARYERIIRYRVFWFYVGVFAPALAFAFVLIAWRHF